MVTPSFSDFNVTRREAKLPNDIRVIVFEKPKAPISMVMLFLSGSRFDPVGKEGLAHFTEHMVMAGTKRFPTKDALAVFIENLGGSFGASTGLETFSIQVNVVDPEDFQQAATMLNEIVSNAIFDSKTIETERGAILRELSSKEADPSSYIGELSRSLYLQGTLCARSGLGTRESIEGITREDLVNYYDKMLTSGRAVIVVSGGIGLEDVVATLNANLNMRKSEKVSSFEQLPTNRDISVRIKEYKTNDLVHVSFGFRVCDCYAEDAIPLRFLGQILGGGRASRLTKKLRYEKGYVYHVDAGYSGASDFGVFGIHTKVLKKNIQEVFNIITNELTHLVDNGVSEEELEFTKNRSIKSKKATMQTSGSWVNFHIYDELFERGINNTLPEYLAAVAAITTKDILSVSKKYLVKDSWYLTMCGDIKEDEVTINL